MAEEREQKEAAAPGWGDAKPKPVVKFNANPSSNNKGARGRGGNVVATPQASSANPYAVLSRK